MKRKTVILSIILLVFISQVLFALSNPIPIDENYECSPVSSNYEGPISFTHEVINVRFDSSMAYFEAIYTFKNSNQNTTEITIQLPLKEYEGLEDFILQKNQQTLEYKWVSTTVKYGESRSQEEEFRAVEFTLLFAAAEEIDIRVQYSRPYTIYDFFENPEVQYNFMYLVGTARAWTQPLKSAKFVFWIPMEICDKFYISGHPEMTLSEGDSYYVLGLEFINWIPEENFIDVHWSRSRKGIEGLPFAEPLSLSLVFLILIIYHKHWKKDE